LSAAGCARSVSPAPSGSVDFIFLNILRWSDLTQRPHHLARGLGERGYRVFWVDVRLIPVEEFDGTVETRDLAANVVEVRLPGVAGDIYHSPWSADLLDLMTGAMGQLREAEGIGRAVQIVNFPGWRRLAQETRKQFGWP